MRLRKWATRSPAHCARVKRQPSRPPSRERTRLCDCTNQQGSGRVVYCVHYPVLYGVEAEHEPVRENGRAGDWPHPVGLGVRGPAPDQQTDREDEHPRL